jgi:anti-anti-sigma factor
MENRGRAARAGRDAVISYEAGFSFAMLRVADELTVAASGELDASVAGSFGESIIEECGRTPVHLRLEADGMTFLDSGGLQALISILRHVRRHGGDLTVTGSSRTVRRVLDITGFATLSGVSVP